MAAASNPSPMSSAPSGPAGNVEVQPFISSSFLLYNILEQRINAQSSGEGDEKVKITVIPETIEEQLPEEDIAELEIPDLEIPEDRRQ